MPEVSVANAGGEEVFKLRVEGAVTIAEVSKRACCALGHMRCQLLSHISALFLPCRKLEEYNICDGALLSAIAPAL